jgi:hypothetical protein
MMTSTHYLTTLEQKASKETTTKEHEWMKQKQLTTNKQRFRDKANKEVAKQQRILNREAKKKIDEAWSTKANY